ncbi:MAG: GTPase HflX [Firmicutes bacterium GWF2_51_9]|nr:GTPase HflX [Erysipelotrichaceae bacterium]OGS54310.1 MAG: GTPase HflX [Firmicutes bacterium GWF2_51_9]OGS57550.1 MAG: GTPase HflX [Firmicutes bacterium GWE2_51_13]HAM64039.1 GTPase HflX [Erysipelotrichaceae bacterium]HAO61867.1 GTPase HflX [Erysipelotrichaceae bacterium]
MKPIAILVALETPERKDFEQEIRETEALAEACDITVAQTLTQKAASTASPTYIKSGKLEELLQAIEAQKADVVLFNDELSGSQLRNLEERLPVTILDRTQLILRIFEQRAKTREAKLQVQVAELTYQLPRSNTRHGSFAGRQQGGGSRNRGSGESQIEINRRHLKSRIQDLQEELRIMEIQRQTQRKQRLKKDLPNIALVGYTNAGKSTLMNAFIKFLDEKESKFAQTKDMLFATLDTASRGLSLRNGKNIVLTDTVGFVSHLPHGLIKAFRSTLEEILEADILLHVIDAAHPDAMKQAEITLATIKEIGAGDIPMINVFNKTDKSCFDVPVDGVRISAKFGTGMEELISAVEHQLSLSEIQVQLFIPFENQNLISKIRSEFRILSMTETETGTLVQVSGSPDKLAAYRIFFRIVNQ